MTRDDHRSPGRLAPPRPDHRWGPGASVASSRRLADVPGQPRADRWEAAPDEDLYRASHPLDVQESYQPGDPYAVDSGPAQVPRARPRSYSPHEGAYSDVRAQEYVAEAPPPVNAAYYSPPSRAQYPTYESETKPGPLSMQDRYILLMRTIELHDDAWRLASIRANEEKDRLEAYLIPRNKRLELKQAIHRNQFMVITIDRLGNTTIKQPRREGLLRRIWRWLFGGD